MLLLPLGLWLGLWHSGAVDPPTGFSLSDRIATLEVVDGDFRFEDGTTLSAEAFRDEVAERRGGSPLPTAFRWLDITSWTGLFWLVFGLLAQMVFMGRLLVQWLASEKAKASVMPVAFWWLSLLGSSMLVIYFIWRKEPIGILGQATGWFIYVRNLWFIYGKNPEDA